MIKYFGNGKPMTEEEWNKTNCLCGITWLSNQLGVEIPEDCRNWPLHKMEDHLRGLKLKYDSIILLNNERYQRLKQRF